MTAPVSASRVITIPWGESGSLEVAPPEAWPAFSVSNPDLSGALADYRAALGRALDEPEAGPPLGRRVGPGAKVAVVVDDPSRWPPVREALPPILDRLHAAGVRPEDVS